VGGERPQGVRLNLRSFNVLFQVQYSGLKRDRGEFYTEERPMAFAGYRTGEPVTCSTSHVFCHAALKLLRVTSHIMTFSIGQLRVQGRLGAVFLKLYCKPPAYPFSLLHLRKMTTTTPTRHRFFVYAPDKVEEGTLERRISVRPTHRESLKKMVEDGIVRTR